jgi:cytochrome oxidase assembly protein ShyY1
MTVGKDGRVRFPFGLTLGAIVVFVVCCGLGVWQLQRGAWKQHELARIAALKHAPPAPIAQLIPRMLKGEELTFAHAVVDCAPSASTPAQFHLISDKGDWIARTLSPCRLPSHPYDGMVVDRGFLEASRGAPNPPPAILPAPQHVAGVLYPRTAALQLGLVHPAPYVLVADRETPPAPGVTPTPYPDAGDTLQYVGEYWLTWFGLAGAVACVYAAMLWRRRHPKPSQRP